MNTLMMLLNYSVDQLTDVLIKKTSVKMYIFYWSNVRNAAARTSQCAISPIHLHIKFHCLNYCLARYPRSAGPRVRCSHFFCVFVFFFFLQTVSQIERCELFSFCANVLFNFVLWSARNWGELIKSNASSALECSVDILLVYKLNVLVTCDCGYFSIHFVTLLIL